MQSQDGPGFDPLSHQMTPQKAFEDLKIGDVFNLPGRTVGDSNFGAFQLASADNHPIHYDVEYCKAQGHPNLLAHGFQVLLFTTPGSGTMPHVMGEAMIGFLEQSSKFLKPVYLGDTLYGRLEITELAPQRSTGVVTVRSTVHNQNGLLVLEGEQKFLMRLGKPAT